ncbi:MAG: hypothetical protein A2W38_00385 [Deltaproteobacteria bacterium RBG_19FT_COMBO_58_16]|nr:MAG: hypothetical protein A2W38_00385 [Deltaproteobacteria bacterium RBG_19FT_COMBO_58_16]
MKVFTSAIRIRSNKKAEEVNITNQVEAVVLESNIYEGMALVFTGHTTASIHLGNADRDLEDDFHSFLDEQIPNKETYKHNKGDYGRNADAHLKSLLVGSSVTVPITKGRLVLGQWQAIYFSEFEGPRSRLISIKITGLSKENAI